MMYVAVLACVCGVLNSVHVTAAPLSDRETGSGDGLQGSGLMPPAREYSDLLWTKEDYRAWIRGTGYKSPGQGEHDTGGVFPLSFVASSPSPPAGTMSQWRLGERNWGYATDNGLAIRLGSSDVESSVLAGGARLGGVHVKQSGLARRDDVSNWAVSFALGALDYSDSADKGDLSYGPAAANTVIHYGLTERLALESGIQVAPDLVTTTLGARLDAGDWGQVRAGVARGGLADHDGRRYQAAYDVQMGDDLHLSVHNEWDAPGFADLGHYRTGVTGGVRRRWTATVPTQRWGDISGTYESIQPAAGAATQKFGFSQQFWYSPNLRIGLQAQRELDTGDYDIGIRFSVPIN